MLKKCSNKCTLELKKMLCIENHIEGGLYTTGERACILCQ